MIAPELNPSTINPLKLPSLPISERRRLPNCPAVYFVIENEKVIYIGQATSLVRMWLSHNKLKLFRDRGTEITVSWLECNDPSLLSEIEAALIEWFDPDLNIARRQSRTVISELMPGRISEILQDRLKQLGWSRYRLTQEYCRVRGEPTDASSVKRYEGTVKRALQNPGSSSSEVIELLIKALDGEQLIRWNTREEVLTGQKEVKVS